MEKWSAKSWVNTNPGECYDEIVRAMKTGLELTEAVEDVAYRNVSLAEEQGIEIDEQEMREELAQNYSDHT